MTLTEQDQVSIGQNIHETKENDGLVAFLEQPIKEYDPEQMQQSFQALQDANEARDAECKREFYDNLMKLHAWASSRPKMEHESAFGPIQEKMGAIMEVETKQGMFNIIEMARQRLMQFVNIVQDALSTLLEASS